MKYPNFNEEKKLYNRGYKIVVGIDEVGRGPLAGPVVACAFCFIGKGDRGPASLEAGPRRATRLRVRDSKKLSAKQREEIYRILKNNPDVEWGIGRVSEKVIDKINILEATKLAMQRAVKNLEKNLEKKNENIKDRSVQKKCDRTNFVQGSFLIIDGNFGIKVRKSQSGYVPYKSIIKADEKVFSVAAASIIAKVVRDRMMIRYHKKYPDYGFDRHKGYATKNHYAILNKCGPCKLHRISFNLISAK